MKETLKKELINIYNEMAYTHHYMLGFIFNHMVYMITFDSIPQNFIKLDKASRGAGMSLRFKPTVAQKMALIRLGAQVLCSEKFFMEEFNNCKYNRGEVFEMIVAHKNGQDWKKDDTPFTKAGDLTIDGIPYQLKFQLATFANEKFLLGR